MKLFIPRSMFLARLQERIVFLEKGHTAAKEREEKLTKMRKELDEGVPEGRRIFHGSESAEGFEKQLKAVRFAIEHIGDGANVETDLPSCILLGIVDPEREVGFSGGYI